jgi:uncharacterized protein
MTISMYQAAVPVCTLTLNNLIGILKKGAAYAEVKKIEQTVLLNTRLSPDMFPLVKQVQIASDVPRRGIARLAGVEAPSFADEETTFAELIDRLQKTIAFFATITAAQVDGSEEKTITLPVGGGKTMTLAGMPYLLSFVLPNTYFHVTTAYVILRHCGVEVGKGDFLGVS